MKIFLSTCFISLIVASVSASANDQPPPQEWQNASRLAHRYAGQEEFVKSAQLCKRASTLLNSSTARESSDIKLDLKLNEAYYLIRAARYVEAADILNSTQTEIEKSKNELLHLRYWRRAAFLELARRNYARAAFCQRKVIDITANLFGRKSSDYATGRYDLLVILMSANSWNGALEEARILIQMEKFCKSCAQKKVYKHRLETFFATESSEVLKSIVQGSYQKATDFLNEFGPVAGDDHRVMSLADSLLSSSYRSSDRRIRVQAAQLVCHYADRIGNASNATERQSKLTALTTLSFENVYEGRFTEEAEKLIDQVTDSIVRTMPSVPLSENRSYIQAASMRAIIKAKRGKVKEAAAILDLLTPSPRKFNDIYDLDGIYQARLALASIYCSMQDFAAARDQFAKLFNLLSTMRKIPNRDYWSQLWRNAEAKILSKERT